MIVTFKQFDLVRPVYSIPKAGLPFDALVWLRSRMGGTGWDSDETTFIFHHTKILEVAERLVLSGCEVDFSGIPQYLVAGLTKQLQDWETRRKLSTDRVPVLDLPTQYETLHLQDGAPPSVVKAAYRALAKEHHPDRGGDHATMTRLSLAYKAIQDTW